MSLQIKKAVRQQRKARIDLTGPSGAGKTYTALSIAAGFGGKILLLDSERSSASLFADEFDFDIIELPDLKIETYFKAIELLAGYDVGIIDSLSHAWEGVNEEVQNATMRSSSSNSFQQWGKVGNPLYNKLLEKMLSLPCHLITTMRVKSDYVMEEYTSNGKTMTRPKKIGLAPKFREGGEYEFDVVGNLDLEHNLIIEKTRLPFLDGQVINKPGRVLGEKIAEFLNSGAAAPKPPTPKPLTNNDGGVRPAVSAEAKTPKPKAPPPPYEGNPWEHKIEGKGDYVGVPLCWLPDEQLDWLSEEKNRRSYYKDGLVTKLDCIALYWALKEPEKRAAAQKVTAGENV